VNIQEDEILVSQLRHKRHEKRLEHVAKRNFKLGVWNGILFNLGKSFFSPTTVLPAFLSKLTSSSSLIGIIATFDAIGWYLPQLPAAAWVQHKSRKMPIYRLSFALRTIALLVVTITTFFSPSVPVLLVIFTTSIITFDLTSGLGGLVFMDLYAKAIPPNKRGKFLALRMGIGSLLAATLGAGAIYLLERADVFPRNFSYIFGAGTMIIIVGLYMMAIMREPRERHLTDKRTLRQHLAHSLNILKGNPEFRHYVESCIILALYLHTLPFLFLYAKNNLGYTNGDLGIFVTIECAAFVLSNMYWPRVADRTSNRKVVLTTAYLQLTVPLFILSYELFPIPREIFPLVFALTATIDSGRTIGCFGYLVDIIPERDRMTYSAIFNTSLALPLLFVPVSGLILDMFGYSTLYILIALTTVWAIFRLLKLREVHAHERVS
jgi:MFS family permease